MNCYTEKKSATNTFITFTNCIRYLYENSNFAFYYTAKKTKNKT